MQALAKVERSHGALQLVERDQPEPAADEALVEVDYGGLCGSDAGIFEFESAFERMELPTVIGHEYSGRVVAVGDNVTKFDVGDNVVERPIRGCGDCYQWEIGEENVCQDAVITGVDHNGAYAGLLEDYYQKLYPLSRLMAMPEKEELPFYDADEHESMTKDERIDMYQAWSEYRENLRNGRKPEE